MQKLLIIFLIITGCQVASNYQPPKLQLPNDVKVEEENFIDYQDWWKKFADSNIDYLVNQALANNSDLTIAAHNINQAIIQLKLVNLDYLPTLGAQFNVNGIKNYQSKSNINYGLGLVLNYELDLWGKNKYQKEIVNANLMVNNANFQLVRLTIVSMVIKNYLNIIAINQQIELSNRLLNLQIEYLELKINQFQAQLIDLFQLNIEQQKLVNIKSKLNLLKQKLLIAINAMNNLIGKIPQTIKEHAISYQSYNKFPSLPVVPNEITSSFIKQRLDIASKEQSLRIADAQIGVVRTNYLPSISLNALLGYSHNSLKKLINKQYSIMQILQSTGINQPLIDFGRNNIAVDIAKLARDKAESEYKATIISAVGEVITALENKKAIESELINFSFQEQNQLNNLKLAQQRYQYGYSAKLDLIQAQVDLVNLNLNKIEIIKDRLDSVVEIFRVLGEGW